MDKFTQKLSQWSYQRQGLLRPDRSLIEALHKVVAVYSAHPSGPLSLWARVAHFDKQEFINLDQHQLAVRLPAMRLSNHQMPAATAPYLIAATLPAKSSNAWAKRYAQRGLADADYQQWKLEILKLTTAPQTAKKLKSQITFDADQLKFVLNRLSYEGDLLRIGSQSLRSNIIAYVATTHWMNWSEDHLTRLTQTAGLQWLAKAYFSAFAPARVKDFQWWAGINAGQAQTAIKTLDAIQLPNDYLILAEDAQTFEHFEPTLFAQNTVAVLPQWDSYLMGYAPDGRARLVADEHLAKVYGKLGATGGNALGTLLVNGEVKGIWKHKFKGTQVQFESQFFDKPTAQVTQAVHAQLNEIGALMEANKITIT
ncbi:DNA glycosylase AlkZ-like family protein [Microscilla marina]|uniref:Winged helix DNA-binding domain-containing protein n=1 Tax=Microscilla marina ATCC 23134 TaxID=313606 RepID=A1ZZP6_MICM2|nr:crosslink repair DNA glycosylase YcaQ family protein [Microscilla marina]EAY24154.1 hypothetical protein M23134_00969 [Microscilla marina ATCC 23134]